MECFMLDTSPIPTGAQFSQRTLAAFAAAHRPLSHAGVHPGNGQWLV